MEEITYQLLFAAWTLLHDAYALHTGISVDGAPEQVSMNWDEWSDACEEFLSV